jgi:hypothetical protein
VAGLLGIMLCGVDEEAGGTDMETTALFIRRALGRKGGSIGVDG